MESKNLQKPISQPTIIPRSSHCVSRADISPNALKVLYRLRSAGYRACLVGGGVRDLLLGREPKDFDVVTDAHPEEIYRLFRNCRLIGRRFRLAHIRFDQEIIEVATFRGHQADSEDEAEAEGSADTNHLFSDNVYGSIEEDAWRRDLTINALYYDIDTFAVLDYVDGMADLQAGIIRLIGDPQQRYREDPVRMLRVVRFAAKLGFRLHPDTEQPLSGLGHLLKTVPPARLFDEALKLFLGGYAVQTFELLRHYGLFAHLFPETEQSLRREEQGYPRTLVVRALANTDSRIGQDKPVTPAFLYAALLWYPLRERVGELLTAGESEYHATQLAAEKVIQIQLRHTALPRRFSLPMKEIWSLQSHFEVRSGKRPLRLLAHPRFRAAYDFLLLRAEAGEEVAELADWWTWFQSLEEEEREKAIRSAAKTKSRRRRRRVAHKGGSSAKAP